MQIEKQELIRDRDKLKAMGPFIKNLVKESERNKIVIDSLKQLINSQKN